MPANIKCPNCQTEFALGEAEAEEYKKELRQQMNDYKKQKDDEFQQRQADFDKQKTAIESAAFNKAGEKLKMEMISLQEEAKEKTLELQKFKKRELDLLRERTALEERTKDMELEIEKRLLENRKKIETEVIQRGNHLSELKIKEKDLQLDGMKKTIEELKRKSEQGSMQIQGEAQELMLEEMLRNYFPYDTVTEVRKGAEGADCILIVRNHLGIECGKIIFESKRTKGWQNAWVEKLKKNMRNMQVDVAVLVSQIFPKEMTCFGEKDGVWISSFKEVIPLTTALRHTILRIAEMQKSEENKGEKMNMLYGYLTGTEFRQQIETIVESFSSLKNSIIKEKMQMEKIWKEREKQLEKVLISTSGMYGSIKGIAGASIGNIPLLENNIDEDD
ncbi:MAG: DUF2130 domain-containing protein [Bacteroidota bacterium]|nr:DUF2130 domain-containing protein [Bacteroidota bacterium]